MSPEELATLIAKEQGWAREDFPDWEWDIMLAGADQRIAEAEDNPELAWWLTDEPETQEPCS